MFSYIVSLMAIVTKDFVLIKKKKNRTFLQKNIKINFQLLCTYSNLLLCRILNKYERPAYREI